MENPLLLKEQNEVKLNELFAYTLAKIKPFVQARIQSHFEDKIFNYPPIFVWRYAKNSEDIYEKLQKCISSYKGKMEWIMYKCTKNYCIEPVFIYNLRQKMYGEELERFLKINYEKNVFDAIEDITPLCQFIEEKFEIAGKKPLPRTEKEMEMERDS